MLRVLRHRDFGLLWTGQAVSLLGDGIYLIAIAWLVYDLSNSPSALGLVGLAWTAPQVLALLASGVLSDRYDRRRLLITADLLRVAAIGGIAALSITDALELWQVTVLVVVYGLGEALFQPAFTAIVPDVVPQDELLQASALKELMEPIGLRFAGPALGGLLIAVGGVGTAFVVDAASFAVSAVAVSLMSRQPAPPREVRPVLEELRAGFAFVRARPWLWATLASAAVALLASFGPIEVLVPYLIRNDLGGGAATFGAVLSAGGLGSITAALVLGRTGAPRRHVTFMYAGWALSGGLTAGFALASAAWQMCVVAFVSFAAATAGMVVWNTLIQTRVPTEMLGRVSSLDWFVSIGLVPLSFALTGPIAELVGAKETLVGAGVLGLVACAALFLPGVRDPEARPLPG
ncbi:MAG TPA: MFS transporter [Thermoleophilaceae bacterium]|nr:MFS transporter [Thermoleophilaceae bacterium]